MILKKVSSFHVTSCTDISTDRQSEKLFLFTSFIERFSDLYKLNLSTGWLERFKSYILGRSFKTSEKPGQSPILVLEQENTELDLARYVQWQEFASVIAIIKRGSICVKTLLYISLTPLLQKEYYELVVDFKFDLT